MKVVDPAALAQEITPYLAAAVRAYGTSVLAQTEDMAAGATVVFGQRLIRRLVRREPGGTGKVTSAVNELAGNPLDTGLQAVLRVAIAEAFRSDPRLAAEIEGWRRPETTAISALGERSVAAHTVNGPIITGNIHLERA
jgi:hypothetical protein